MYKATGFTLESLGVKQQCLHCCTGGGRSDWVVNMLTHSKHRHRECIRENFPAKLHVNIWRDPAREDGQLQNKGLRGCLSSMGEMYSSAHMGKGEHMV